MDSYLNFDIEIGQGHGLTYPVRLHSPGGDTRTQMVLPFDELALENALLKLEIALLYSGGVKHRTLFPEEQAVQNFGKELFDALFSGEIRTRLDVSLERAKTEEKGLRIRLCCVDERLASLPWEFLYDTRLGEYICLRGETPLVRTLELVQPIPPMIVKGPLHILGMIASPTGGDWSLNVIKEKERMEKALGPLVKKQKVKLIWLKEATRQCLQKALRQESWHIFHFIGHGGYDPVRREGAIMICDDNGQPEMLHATALARILTHYPGLRLAFLNACEGTRSNEHDIFNSVALALVRRGLPATIAMQYKITDAAAIRLSQNFYESLAEGLPVDVALGEGRLAISTAVDNSLEWGTPVLYLRSQDGQLFDRESPEIIESSEISVGAISNISGSVINIGTGNANHTALSTSSSSIDQLSSLKKAIQAGDWQKAMEILKAIEVQQGNTEQLLVFRHRVDRALKEQAESPQLITDHKDEAPNNQDEILALEMALDLEEYDAAVQLLRKLEMHYPSDERLIGLSARVKAQQRKLSVRYANKQLSLVLNNKLQIEFVSIPGGEFLMGSDSEIDKDAFDNEKPQHRLVLNPYWIGRYPVTTDQFGVFVSETGYRTVAEVEGFGWHWDTAYNRWIKIEGAYWRHPFGLKSNLLSKEKHPVVQVSFRDALAFCGWLSNKVDGQVLIPSEAEWEKASRGRKGSIYPWGNEPPDEKKCNFNQNINDTTAVGYYSPQGDSEYGCSDMAGNVWEWTRSLWGVSVNHLEYTYPYNLLDKHIEDINAGSNVHRIVRGGSWSQVSGRVRCAHRNRDVPDDRYTDQGFRCLLLP